MTQQFRIESEDLRDKLNRLLPSQNRGSIGVDLSGSTTIIPIVDLTETAEGSNLRQDLQTSFSLTNITHTSVSGATSTLVNTTGYYRVFGSAGLYAKTTATFKITDGVTTKNVLVLQGTNLSSGADVQQCVTYDFLVKLEAGDSLQATSSSGNNIIKVTTRQIADVSGNLINP